MTAPRPADRFTRTAPRTRPSLARFVAPVLTTCFLLLTPLSLSVVLSSGCKGEVERPTSELGTVDMRIGNRTFRLEVAATERSRAYGLMNRRSLPEDRGMIFVFREEEPRQFHMKNTLIPLDIIYVDGSGRVVSVHRMEAMAKDVLGQWKTTPSDGPAQFAIELNAGAAAAAGVKVGDVLDIPREARMPGNLE